ncbi:MAG: hypothetical protein LBO09_06670 [Candidatus Peribacteria bacterium]|jgi:hypothetical protein|nr:hypothetical protein [Candidatus Peribacteria bacterium]
MYLFSFKKYAGHDRVFRSPTSFGHPGDLLETQDDFLLNLGEEIAFPELYTYQFSEQPLKILYPGFFDQHFLSFLHRMVYEWYSSYKSVMRYFVSMEMQELLLRESKLPRFRTLGSSVSQ